MRSKYWVIAAAIVILSTGFGHALAVKATLDDCEKKREYCIKSCMKQRKDCDDKGNPSNYCVKQDEACTNACNKEWRKCSEKKFAVTDIEFVGNKASFIY